MIDLNKMTRRFLMGESVRPQDISAYVQALQETLEAFKFRTTRDSRRMIVAKEQLREIKLRVRRMTERINMLEEQVQILEEGQ